MQGEAVVERVYDGSMVPLGAPRRTSKGLESVVASRARIGRRWTTARARPLLLLQSYGDALLYLSSMVIRSSGRHHWVRITDDYESGGLLQRKKLLICAWTAPDNQLWSEIPLPARKRNDIKIRTGSCCSSTAAGIYRRLQAC